MGPDILRKNILPYSPGYKLRPDDGRSIYRRKFISAYYATRYDNAYEVLPTVKLQASCKKALSQEVYSEFT